MPAPNFPKMEEEILDFWKKEKIFEKTLAKKSPKGSFIFFEGPPTANGKPGLHHVEARVFKDIICRYKTMQGYFVGRKAGWDTHGLPVELQVEKELKFSGKPDIEKYGIKEFNEKCKESVWRNKEEFEKMTERIAYWVDMENPYITYDNTYIESLWWILKQIWDKGLLYEGYKILPQCPRCGTALSSHEVALGYKNVEEMSVYIKFKVTKHYLELSEDLPLYVLSWTTTPWTLPGNVALAVGENIDYVLIKKGKEYFIIAKALAEKVVEEEYSIEKEMKGKDLIGIEYEPLFPGSLDPGDKKAWYITSADFVSTEDGTGVVHTAVMYGEDDFNLGKKIGLPEVHTVDENGLFLPSVKRWAGKFVKNVEKEISEDLRSRDLLYKTMPYAHDYPFCWRCSTPLLYYAKKSWFIKMSDPEIKEKLIQGNQTINWVPEYIRDGRFGDWLREVKDWAITRERYWGTPLPIWKCGCGEIVAVESIAELEKLSGKNLKEMDLHRPFIDEITLPCKNCGGEMRRSPEVLDCWFDSGAMPFAQWHYPFENKEKIDDKKEFPADFISEAIDQTRGWFYTLLAVSTLLGREVPYKNVICLGHLRDTKGEKMSKSKGNIVDPWEVIGKYGSDAVRWFFFTINQPGDPKNFSPLELEIILKKFFLVLFNILSFYKLYEGKTDSNPKNPSHVLDKWIMAKLNLLIKETSEKLDAYDVIGAARGLEEFNNDLSTWYVRRSRDRFKEIGEDKDVATATLRFVLKTFGRLSAPFIPFVAEKINEELGKENISIHLDDWPELEPDLIDEKVLERMEVAKKIVEAGLAARASAGIKIRQPLASYTNPLAENLGEEYVELIKDELNISELKSGEENLDEKITEELKEQGLVREIVRLVNSLRKEAGLTISDRIVIYFETKNDAVLQAFQNNEEKITKDTLSNKIKFGRSEVSFQKENNVEGSLWLGITKH
ncbi:MAG TPA: isoleucine--tRNA ligase [Patescibacteria group bacterium]|nr:isoleucine--tRNA ligase [Patescibacteria group bacterium]